MSGHLPYLVAAWLFAVGMYGLVASRNLVGLCICLSIVQSSTYVLLLAIGYKTGAAAPVFANIPEHTLAVDSVVQAMMLTDIVVEATVFALLLSLAIQIERHAAKKDPDHLQALRES